MFIGAFFGWLHLTERARERERERESESESEREREGERESERERGREKACVHVCVCVSVCGSSWFKEGRCHPQRLYISPSSFCDALQGTEGVRRTLSNETPTPHFRQMYVHVSSLTRSGQLGKLLTNFISCRIPIIPCLACNSMTLPPRIIRVFIACHAWCPASVVPTHLQYHVRRSSPSSPYFRSPCRFVPFSYAAATHRVSEVFLSRGCAFFHLRAKQ